MKTFVIPDIHLKTCMLDMAGAMILIQGSACRW